jgi:hypothetical protein
MYTDAFSNNTCPSLEHAQKWNHYEKERKGMRRQELGGGGVEKVYWSITTCNTFGFQVFALVISPLFCLIFILLLHI